MEVLNYGFGFEDPTEEDAVACSGCSMRGGRPRPSLKSLRLPTAALEIPTGRKRRGYVGKGRSQILREQALRQNIVADVRSVGSHWFLHMRPLCIPEGAMLIKLVILHTEHLHVYAQWAKMKKLVSGQVNVNLQVWGNFNDYICEQIKQRATESIGYQNTSIICCNIWIGMWAMILMILEKGLLRSYVQWVS